jgi:CubicO group peptidase (beta-lactamase class C family)
MHLLTFGILISTLMTAASRAGAEQVGTTPPRIEEQETEALEPRSFPAARLAPGQALPPAELEAYVDGVVRQVMSTERIAGASVAVVQDDEMVLEKGYGFADVERRRPVDARTTLFRIGSITKTFTWAALMNAVEAGRIGLDDPVNDHLPPELRIPDEGFPHAIRIRHLMTHTPGFEDSILGHLFEREPERVRPLATYLREERPGRVREPGIVSTYSNYGVALAGAILERLHGRPWQEIVEIQIIEPLGLSYTTGREPYPSRDDLPAAMPQRLADHLSEGYRWTGVDHVRRGFEYLTHIAPAGAISSSAGDMGRYMRMLLNDGRLDGVGIFGEQAARAFRTPMTDLPRAVGNWAAGFWELPLPGEFSNFGHDGGSMVFFSSMVLVPELRLGIFVATNTEGGADLSGPLPGLIVEHFYAPARQVPPGSPALASAREVYEGYYLMTRRPYRGLEGFIFRLQTLRVIVTPDGYLALPVFGRTHRFVPTGQPEVFQPVDAAASPFGGVLFKRDGDRATRMETFIMAFERVGPLFQPPTLLALAVLTLLVSFGTLFGVRLRARRGLPQTGAQQVAGWLHVAAAIAWIVSAAGIVVFAAGAAADLAEVVYAWPAPSILVFSIAALVASLLSVSAAAFLPAVWRPGDRPGWSRWRTLRFTLATMIFIALGSILALWGALRPW